MERLKAEGRRAVRVEWRVNWAGLVVAVRELGAQISVVVMSSRASSRPSGCKTNSSRRASSTVLAPRRRSAATKSLWV